MSTLWMFPPVETPAEDTDLLAGEYALGVLDPGEAAALRLRADADPALLAAIAAWQARLLPLTDMLTPTALPPTLWARLAAEIGLASPAPPPPPLAEPIAAPIPPPPAPQLEPAIHPSAMLPEPEPEITWLALKPEPEPVPEPVPEPEPITTVATPIPGGAFALLAEPQTLVEPVPEPPSPAPARLHLLQRLETWRAATALALLLAVVLGTALLLARPTPSASVAAIGVVNAPAPIYLADADGKGSLRISPLALIAVPGGRDLQLWMIPPGGDTPVSLGVLAGGGQTVSLGGAPLEGTRLIVSLEPRGGSTTGKITGQVLYGGTLANR